MPCVVPRPPVCSWTQQLDGILTSSSDGMLTMWHLRPLAVPMPPRPERLPPALPHGLAGTSPAAEAVLRAAWSVHAPTPQRLVCAGVSVHAPSATAAGRDAAGDSSSGDSSIRGGSEAARYASVWWPQLREQRQRHYAAGVPSVGQEKLRHPATVSGLQWSPGVLQKDVLSMAAAASSAAPGADGEQGLADPSSPTSATSAAIAATEAEDHPALMTLTDGAVQLCLCYAGEHVHLLH